MVILLIEGDNQKRSWPDHAASSWNHFEAMYMCMTLCVCEALLRLPQNQNKNENSTCTYGTKCLSATLICPVIEPAFNRSSAISRKDGYISFRVCRAYASVNRCYVK